MSSLLTLALFVIVRVIIHIPIQLSTVYCSISSKPVINYLFVCSSLHFIGLNNTQNAHVYHDEYSPVWHETGGRSLDYNLIHYGFVCA